jgi:hypothetical protein
MDYFRAISGVCLLSMLTSIVLLAKSPNTGDSPAVPAICQDFVFPLLSPKADQQNINMADNGHIRQT